MRFDFSLLARLLILLWLSTGFSQAMAQNFPLPESLKPNVEFWKRVFSEIDGGQGFMHDDRDLSRVYETITVPKNSSRRPRKRIVDAARQRIKKEFERISTRRLDKLSESDLRVRRMFPLSATPRDIRAASRHIRFQLGQADKFEKAIRRSGYYTRYIKNNLNREGLPIELAVLPFVESSFNVRANSHVGAAGIWQFMPATGRRFMKVNHIIDERYDPYRASDAAARLLKYNYTILKSWPLAITAYNHGVGGMRRAIRKTGTTDIGVIVEKYRSRTFGFASRNFYAEFLAVLAISRNASRYFPGVYPYPSQDLVRFKLNHYVPSKALASTLGVPLDELRMHNLALRESVWDGGKRLPANYELRIPAHLVTGNIDRQLATIPQTARFSEQVPDKTYRVRRGDSLSRIAAVYRVKTQDLVMMNNLRSRHRIRVGQVLYLPQKGQPIPQPKPVVSKPEPVVVAVAETPQPKLVDIAQEVQSVETPTAEAHVAEKPVRIDTEEVLVEDEVLDSVQQISATDPAEYSVENDNTIEVLFQG
jgi:membrane-bound lytic murein transglycosylase D